MELGDVLCPVELHAVELFAERGGDQPLPEGLAAPVRLDDRIHPLDAFEVLGPLVAPGARAGEAEGREAVVPEGVAVALALDEEDVARGAHPFQAPEAVEGRFGALAPAETVIAAGGLLQGEAEADRGLRAVLVEVRDPHGASAHVVRVGEAVVLEEPGGQALGVGVGGERAGVRAIPGDIIPLSPLAAGSAVGEEVRLADAPLREGGEHLALAAAGEAAQEDAAVFGLADAEVGALLVVVGGAEGEVLALAVGTGDDFELLEHALYGLHAALLSAIRAAPPARTISTAWSGSSSSTAASSPQAARSESRRRAAPGTRKSKTTSS